MYPSLYGPQQNLTFCSRMFNTVKYHGKVRVKYYYTNTPYDTSLQTHNNLPLACVQDPEWIGIP